MHQPASKFITSVVALLCVHMQQSVLAAETEAEASKNNLQQYRIIFSSDRGGERDLFQIRGDGSNIKNVTQNPMANDQTPMPSTDGKRISFFSGEEKQAELYTMDLDGKNRTRLTHNQATEYYTSWSPEGQHIAFQSDRSGRSQLYIMDKDGSNTRRLTDNKHYDSHPMWSPDGNWITFHSRRNGKYGIYVIKPDGTQERLVTPPRIGAVFPKWSPDGKYITFDGRKEGSKNADIFTISIDGSQLNRVTDNHESDIMPSWSYDGQKLTFISNRTGSYEIYIMDVDGTNQQRITHDNRTIYHPQFLPN